jgi:hypothetical protein
MLATIAIATAEIVQQYSKQQNPISNGESGDGETEEYVVMVLAYDPENRTKDRVTACAGL